ncbi:MAG: hypothetical protein JRH20_08790 [Deltaproteobacteria bacterium]|nr:hypothetical protein [Deltaproteobacteria bacterium]
MFTLLFRRALLLTIPLLITLPLNGARAEGKAKIARQVQLVGTKLVCTKDLRRAIGTPPTSPTRAWAKDALRRALIVYRGRGYTLARGWALLANGRVTLHIDEGTMVRITFVGASTVKALLWRVELYLPEQVFHRPTLQEALKRIKGKYNLRSAYYRIRNVSPTVKAPDGSRATRRELRLYFLTRESFGWGVDVALRSTYGVVPSLSVAKQSTLFAKDRLSAKVSVAFPYRQYLFTESPKFQWVHGRLSSTYRLPFFVRRLAPRIDGAGAISRFQRADLNLDNYFRSQAEVLLALELLATRRLSLLLRSGYANTGLWGFEQASDSAGSPTYHTQSIDTFAADVRAKLALGRDVLRRDMQDELWASARLEVSSHRQWWVETRVGGQYVWNIGHHNLILRGHGWLLSGDPAFWKERPIADFARVFFDNRYWLREAATLDIAFRVSIYNDRFKLGVFHDLVVFHERRGDDNAPAALANAFGPAVHLLVLDSFAIDIFYGFGFAPSGFDHNMVFRASKVF